MIRGVKNGPSPQWLQDALKAIGLRPISALVDITNYFTFDLCRPLHVFDVALVQGDTLTYTLTVVVANGPTTAPVELTDTLSTQVENLQVTNLGSFTQSGTATVPVFTLPANTANGSYSVTYTVVVKSDATGSVGNSVVVTNNGGDPTPSCPAKRP